MQSCLIRFGSANNQILHKSPYIFIYERVKYMKRITYGKVSRERVQCLYITITLKTTLYLQTYVDTISHVKRVILRVKVKYM